MKISLGQWGKEGLVSFLVISLIFIVPILVAGDSFGLALKGGWQMWLAPFMVALYALINFVIGFSLSEGAVGLAMLAVFAVPLLFLRVQGRRRRRILWGIWSVVWSFVMLVSAGALYAT